MKKVLKIILLVILALFALMMIIAVATGGNDKTDTTKASTPKLEYGELLEITDNRKSLGVIIVKAKIKSSYSNDATIKQNYYNIENLVKEQGYNDCDIQYWAVADMTSGNETKVMSFTVPTDVVKALADGKIVANEIGEYATDLYIHDSLK